MDEQNGYESDCSQKQADYISGLTALELRDNGCPNHRTLYTEAIKELLLPNQPIREYSIEWDKHEALKCIHPSDDACIVRKNDDGELYIAWLEKDLQIKLKEFKEEELLY